MVSGDDICIRPATEPEAPWLVTMIYGMVQEMARYGGHEPAAAEIASAHLMRPIAEQLSSKDTCYVVAESAQGERLGVAGAEMTTLGGAYAPKRVLHISAVYVLPAARVRGIGSRLLTAVLEWGRAQGIDACDLNVIAGNPAKSLYEKFGFSTVQCNMMRRL
jgi:ribosomal protein S18 acetylase RimI-like enzyme